MARITLATLHIATAQQVFEQVRDHMLRQGKKSTVSGLPDSMCAYRGGGGAMCAAGCLIADGEYHASMEGATWGGQADFPTAHARLIRQMQLIHDAKPVELWEYYLRALAKEHGLAWSITLATLPTASAQEVFEQVAKHLLKQNAQSIGYTGCAYRGRDGMSCAAGALLSDADWETLEPHDNGVSWLVLADRGIVPKVHTGLIRSLQRLHDGREPDSWHGALRTVAAHFGLDTSFMESPAPVSLPETAAA